MKIIPTLTLIALLAVACSSSSPTKVVTVTQTPPVRTVTQSAAATDKASSRVGSSRPDYTGQYVRAVFGFKSDEIRAAAAITAPGSPADAYRRYISYDTEVGLDSGNNYAQDVTVTKTADGSGWKACASSGGDTCATYSHFQVNSKGQIVNLLLGGKPLKNRISLGNGQAVVDQNVRAIFLAAYNSPFSNYLYVIIQLRNDNSQSIGANYADAIYRSPAGAQRQADGQQSEGQNDIEGHSSTLLAMAFPSVTFGGTVRIDGCVNGCNGEYSLTIKTR